MDGQSNKATIIPVTDRTAPTHVPKRVVGSGGRKSMLANLLLRIFGAVVLVTALVLMATDEQTAMVSVFKIKAKFSDAKAFKAFVAATSIVMGYLLLSAIAVLLFLRPAMETTSSRKTIAWLIFLSDQLMTYFLLGATAASTEVAYIAKYGSNKVGWTPICDRFNKFCNHAAAALALGYLGVLTLGMCAVLSVHGLINHRNTS
ncbi:hypothetical protein O6H91_10G044300 [Diphasiastrum complanatum]|uniref:Uncharacterized protein n=1 Tax=Diphasiastrum complanatum TaxID=34168 RepID=A0ACC2CGD6_DIPCM|nr:hypothetical protein O6H91_10G044300 [Diphasiastrum complanatum]